MTIHSVVIQKLLSTNAHLGRRITAQHFKKFTHGIRNGFGVIDSEKTLICLRSACQFLGALSRQKAQFLFVATDPLHEEIFAQMTQRIGCRFDNKWGVGGYLTNALSPKRYRSRRKKISLTPARLPDCLVVVDATAKSKIVSEAYRMHIPIVALVDSALPSETYAKITYPVPARDSVPFVYLFCNLITKTILLEQKKKQDHSLKLPGSSSSSAKRSSSSSPQQPFADADNDVLVREDALLSEKSRDELPVVLYESLTPISDDPSQVRKLLDRFAVLQFNDCVGEKMGFKGPKSTIEVSNGLTYLDLIINQIESLNVEYGCRVPLLVMNTNKTNDDTVKVLEKYSKANIDIHTFLEKQFSEAQSFQGEGSQDGLCQLDHIEALLSLKESGTLDVLLSQGKEYILMVSSDNVALVIDPKILNRLIQTEIECCTEVTPIATLDLEDSTINSQARKIKLAEITQFPPMNSREKFSFIDTRNLWVNLNATKQLLEIHAVERRNHPNPKDSICQPLSRALQFFDYHVGIDVPPSRFLPWETTSDLLLLQSDLYTLAKGILIRNEARKMSRKPSIVLGSEFEKVSDFQSRFKSIPSIIELDHLEVSGDVWFGSGITLKGVVRFHPKPGIKLVVPDGAVLENKVITLPSDL